MLPVSYSLSQILVHALLCKYPLASPVLPQLSDALHLWHARIPAQSCLERICCLRRDSDHQSSGGLRIKEQVLKRQRQGAKLCRLLRIAPVPVCPGRNQSQLCKFKRARKKLKPLCTDMNLCIRPLCHLQKMPQQSKARDIRTGMHGILHHNIPRVFIQSHHKLIYSALLLL